MLRDFVSTKSAQQRHLATPIGPHLSAYLEHRRGQGFATSTIAADLRFATAFGNYLSERECRSLSEIGEDTVEAFVASYLSQPRCYGPKRAGHQGSTSKQESLRGSLRALVGFLRKAGIAKTPPPPPPEPFADVLEEYLSFLRLHRGFADLTIQQHRRWGICFFREISRSFSNARLSELSASDVEQVYVCLAQGLGRRCRQIMTTTVEALVRHLHCVGSLSKSCTPFFPRAKTYALSALPSVISQDEIERAVAGIDRSGEMGLRDYALVLMLATYGLRASEVASLRLDDFDWRSGTLRVSQTKTRRTLHLPILPRVRDALVAYLRLRASTSAERALFTKIHAPHGRITRTVVYAVVMKTLKLAGVEADHYGPHALRHARATALLRGGKTLKDIGDLLGHRVPEATLIYCKVAVDDLRMAALDVLEVIQ